MNRIEFLKECQPFNKKYYEIWGYVPVHTDFVYDTYDKYLISLKMSVENKQPLDKFLKKLKIPKEKNVKL